ncbi:MAG TPA: hypothetical protein VMW24_24620 [Sedimentisphaerales bacterium]|nr:hypothetical protein [Sedimentisphaerales bacterium]
MEQRIITAANRCAKYMLVYCNGEDETSDCRAALVPEQPNDEAIGWMDGYAWSKKGRLLCGDAGGNLLIVRRHGVMRWCWEDGHEAVKDGRAEEWLRTGELMQEQWPEYSAAL